MKNRIFIFAILLTLLFAVPTFAETSLKAEVDKTTITADEALTYKLTITSSQKNLPQPQLPEFGGFQVLSQAQSSQISLAKSNITTVLTYTFILYPAERGVFTIEPARIKIDGQEYSSDSFQIEVKQGQLKPKPQPEQEPAQPKKIQPKSGQPQIII